MLLIRIIKPDKIIEEWLYEDYKMAHKVLNLLRNRFGATQVAIRTYGNNSSYDIIKKLKKKHRNYSYAGKDRVEQLEVFNQENYYNDERSLDKRIPASSYIKSNITVRINKMDEQEKARRIELYRQRRRKKLPLFRKG